MNKPDELHKDFLRALEASKPAVRAVAGLMAELGYRTTILPVRKAPTREQAEQYADGGDLEVCAPVEVKHLGYDFTCLDDWPFPGKMFVMRKTRWGAYKPRPFAVVMLNQAMTHAAMLAGAKHSEWWVETRNVTSLGQEISVEMLVADPTSAHFRELPK